MLRIKTILHPTDFSRHSQAALEVASALARDYEARLVILHVAQVPVLDGSMVVDAAITKRDAEALLQALEVPAGIQQVEKRCDMVELGDSDQAIVKVAGEIQADIIVMGTHGRTGLKRLLLGSIAEHVMRHAPCLVLTVSNKAHLTDNPK
ncbi:MAG TPA: universal stress protein [Gemmatales bacterium]|nr:universal stress protein [Gemmatales bacterium]